MSIAVVCSSINNDAGCEQCQMTLTKENLSLLSIQHVVKLLTEIVLAVENPKDTRRVSLEQCVLDCKLGLAIRYVDRRYKNWFEYHRDMVHNALCTWRFMSTEINVEDKNTSRSKDIEMLYRLAVSVRYSADYTELYNSLLLISERAQDERNTPLSKVENAIERKRERPYRLCDSHLGCTHVYYGCRDNVCGNCTTSLRDTHKLGGYKLSYIYKICSAICAISKSNMPMIDMDQSAIKCDNSINIVGRGPTKEEILQKITPHMINKAVVVDIINSYENVAGPTSDQYMYSIRQQGVRAIQCTTMLGAGLTYISLSDELKINCN